MISSEVTSPETKPEPTFPALYKCGGTVILVTRTNPYNRSEYCGIVVSGTVYKIGEQSMSWNSQEFKRFDGSVTLKNGD